jgi:predicted nucleic acid-binding protein
MAALRVFLDTSGFFAWLNADDDKHDQAVEIVATRTSTFVTTDGSLARRSTC